MSDQRTEEIKRRINHGISVPWSGDTAYLLSRIAALEAALSIQHPVTDQQAEEEFPNIENINIALALCGWRGSQKELLSTRCYEGDLAGVGKWFDACPAEWRDFAKWLLGLARERIDKPGEQPSELRQRLAEAALAAIQAVVDRGVPQNHPRAASEYNAQMDEIDEILQALAGRET